MLRFGMFFFSLSALTTTTRDAVISPLALFDCMYLSLHTPPSILDTRKALTYGTPHGYRSPQEYGKLLVKRLIALPGDKVCSVAYFTDHLSSLKPIIHLTRASTRQVKTLPPYPDTEVVIPDGHGWLEGDAPFNSEDSNHFGPVSIICFHLTCLKTADNNFALLNTHC